VVCGMPAQVVSVTRVGVRQRAGRRRTYRRGGSMLLMTRYKIKPYISNEEAKKLLEVFAEVGAGPNVTAHYVAADASHGVVISELDDATEAYANLQNYTQWVEYDTKVMITVEQAVPLVMESLA
jgi:hypothetical protein